MLLQRQRRLERFLANVAREVPTEAELAVARIRGARFEMVQALNVVAELLRAHAATQRSQQADDDGLGAINQHDDLLMLAAVQMIRHLLIRLAFELTERAEKLSSAADPPHTLDMARRPPMPHELVVRVEIEFAWVTLKGRLHDDFMEIVQHHVERLFRILQHLPIVEVRNQMVAQ